MLKESRKNLIFLSEIKHIDELKSLLNTRADITGEGGEIVALDAQVAYELKDRGIPFISAYDFRTKDPSALVLAEEWLVKLFGSPEWSFFSYRGVSLSRIYLFPIQAYVPLVLYYTDMVGNVARAFPEAKRLIGFSFAEPAPAAGFSLEQNRLRVIVDVIANVAKQTDKEPLLIRNKMAENASHAKFYFKRAVFEFCIGIINTFVRAFRPRKRIKLLVSDYWRNILPYIVKLPSVEIVMFDRMQAFNAGWKNILKYRMNFLHPKVKSPSEENLQARVQIAEGFNAYKKSAGMAFEYRGFSLAPLMLSVLESTISHAVEKTLDDIDATYEFLTRERPNVTLLRSTMSAQTHFVILAEVARNLSLPSLEMQHGLEYYGPGSMDRRHSGEFIGVYGQITTTEMQAMGDTRIIPVVVGSPRFDVHAQTALNSLEDKEKVSVVCVAPPIFPVISPDSYEMIEYFSAVAYAMRGLSNAQITIKLRPRVPERKFFERIIAELFIGMDYKIAELEPLHEVYKNADIVISLYSTAALEALLSDIPLIYLGVSPEQKLMGKQHFTAYEKEGAVYNADTIEKLKEYLILLVNNHEERRNARQRIQTFLSKSYVADGRASERAAKLIEAIARRELVTSDWTARL